MPLEGDGAGFELNVASEKGIFKALKLKLDQNLEEDHFLCGFFLGHALLLAGRPLSIIGSLTFREWESFFRDLNHQECVAPEQLALALKLHESLCEIFLSSVMESAWKSVSAPQMPSEKLLWIERLQWLDVTLREFFAVLLPRGNSLALLGLEPLAENANEYQLLLERPRALEMSESFSLYLEKFLIRTLVVTKEIKLVAE